MNSLIDDHMKSQNRRPSKDMYTNSERYYQSNVFHCLNFQCPLDPVFFGQATCVLQLIHLKCETLQPKQRMVLEMD